jgi:WG containing repeat
MTFSSDFMRLCLAPALALAMLTSGSEAQEILIVPQFEEAGNFHKGVAPVLLDKRWGLIDRSGAWVVRPRYASMLRGGNGLFGVQDDGRWGFIGTAGQSLIAPQFEAAEPFQNGMAAVKANGRWGYLQSNGAMETEFVFEEIGGREGAYVSARDASGWAVFKLSGNRKSERQAIGSKALRAFSVSDSTVIAQFMDGERMYVVVPSFDERVGSDLQTFDVNLFYVNLGKLEKFVSIRRMTDGFAPAAADANKWGYIHKASGEFLWPGRFEDAHGFASGFAPVKIGGKWGYIDRAGRVAIQPAYDAAFSFHGDYAVIRQNQQHGFLWLDPQGGISVFLPPQYEDASLFTEGLAPVKIGGRWGFVSDGRPWSDLVETDIVPLRPK